MSTQDIFGAFETAPLPVVGGPANGAAADPPAAGAVRKTRGPRKTASAPPTAGEPDKRRGRPARKPVGALEHEAAMKASSRKYRGRPARKSVLTATPEPSPTGKLDLNTILLAGVGLSADEARMMVAAVTSLQKISKKSRAKIVTALGKIFA